MNESECSGHKYEHIKTEILTKEDGKKDGRYFTEHGRCIYCGKLFAWSNYVDKTRITIGNDGETGKRIISICEDSPRTISNYYEFLPRELISIPNWVGWKLEERNGKPTKVPYSQTGVMASSTDSTTWKKFEEVKGIPPSKERGIGFVFDGNGIVGIDIDHCLDENGILNPKYAYITESLKSYTEISPSGTGLHIFIRCDAPPYETGKKKNNLEIYSGGRYFTITGNRWLESPFKINAFSPELVRAICNPILNQDNKELKKNESVEKETGRTSTFSKFSTVLSDEDIIKIAGLSKNGDRFKELMSGKSCGDKSSDDMSLANILAFYSDDANQIERIMRMSGLVREKWDRPDYLMVRTIPKAIQERTGRFSIDDYSDVDLKDFEYKIQPASKETVLPPTEKEKENNRKNQEKLSKDAKEYCSLPIFPFDAMPDHIFKTYSNIQSKLMYSHKSYHIAIILPIVSMIFGRRVYSQVGPAPVYTNVSTLAAGVSTISGKSAAEDDCITRIGISVFDDELINKKDSIKLVTDISSDTALKQMLALDNQNVCWYYGDCAAFFEKITNYNRGILPTLCTIWDSKLPLEHRLARKRDGSENFCKTNNYFMSTAFNCTLSDLESYASSSIFTSGWAPRTMWFYENGGKKKKNVMPTDDDTSKLNHISSMIKSIHDEMRDLGPKCIRFNINDIIEDWNIKLSDEYNGDEEEAFNTNLGRIFINCYKIAMIMSMTDFSFIKEYINKAKENLLKGIQEPVVVDIPDKYAKFSIEVGEKYLLPRSLYIYRLSIDCDKKNNMKNVLRAIESLGGDTTRTLVMRKLGISSKDLDIASKDLEEAEQIYIMDGHSPKAKKPTQRYILVTSKSTIPGF